MSTLHYHNGDLHIEDGLVHMRGNGLSVPSDERQAAAQALAGDGYLVVPAAIRRHVDRLEAWCRDATRDDGQALGGIVADLRRAVDGGPDGE